MLPPPRISTLFPYTTLFRSQKNTAVLHRDPSVMPKSKHCWAAWNYASDGDMAEPKLSVTYWMNLLQGIPNETPLFVTLNPKTDRKSTRLNSSHRCISYAVFC